MKTSLIFALSGALLGIAIASYIVPPALSWYSEPGGISGNEGLQALVRVPDVIKFATGKLIRGQAIGAAIGAILGVGLRIVLTRKPRTQPPA